MTSRDHTADRVWEQTLQQIRSTRARRRLRRTALTAGATAALACAGLLFPAGRPSAVQPPEIVLRVDPPTEAGRATLVALIWRDGHPALEQLDPDELGYPDIPFSLEPVLAYSDARWDAF
ncbi:hypothetical protein [Luteolibacter luteus]|uniref:Uncharacterized protein n=1 Tax=Luteolibacter luteus TaxID=2728835 RepID=A0A858RDR3_9BACT|nr:hypothetical protein [Luteolibacter luteus]QJE94862.1 hypothetical protein HHL09_03400 [Luteolibacter luteus]